MTKKISIENLTTYFNRVNDYRNIINHLQSSWDSLALLAQLSGTGTEMEQTRRAFSDISNDVLNNLSKEIMNKTVNHLSSKAFVIINLLVRNLYERTADIGFFSTDDDIRYFLKKYDENNITNEHIQKITFRFEEYQKKYTVYENIVLYDKNGNVVHQLDEKNHVLTNQHEIFRKTLNTSEPYIESFYETEINGKTYNSLVYAYPITAKESDTQIGVLCLCFKFVDELKTIFSTLISEDDWTVGLLLDEHKNVISSSDIHQIPIGAQLKVDENLEWTLSRFAGREYLAVTRKSRPYQGYSGPGWLGLAMIPIEKAFDEKIEDMFVSIDKSVLRKVMRSPLIFSSELLDIPIKVARIQSKLNQSVWNGNIWQSNYVNNQQKNFSKTLLWEVSNTGLKTQNIIGNTVSELYQTVVSVMLDNSSFFAFLGLDIMDRNLYERANDVRWWALTFSFRKILSKQRIDASDFNKISTILQYINSLYTVYENLIVFDSKGEVVAVSNPKYNALVGTTIQDEWVSRVKTCQTFQDYVVSKFDSTSLYGNRPTYIYAAPIKNLEETSIVGGIGIVFDSEPQFKTMLYDVIPRDEQGSPLKGSFTLFVDENNLIISSTHPNLLVGTAFNLIPNLNKLESGKSQFEITNYQDDYYAVGIHASHGYREYKGINDRYKNKVICLIFTPLGNAQEINDLIQAEELIVHNKFSPNLSFDSSNGAVEYASFFIKNTWFGIRADHVKEAIDETNLRSFPEMTQYIAGLHPYKNDVIPIIDLAKLLGEKSYDTSNRQIIVIEDKLNKQIFGLFVSALGEIPYIQEDKIQPMTNLFKGKSKNPAIGMVEVVTGHNLSSMLTIVTPNSLWEKVNVS